METSLPFWTIIGFYPDNDQRFATVYQAKSADEAEQIALTTCHEAPIAICGVVPGFVKMADTTTEVAYQDEAN